MRHSANLDILRSFAVSVVLVDHLVLTLISRAGFNNHALAHFLGYIGQAGVLAFFVHTSLVLMYSLERMTRSHHRVTLRFYVRRFFRIYPLATFCITLALILHIPNVTWRNADIITPRTILLNFLLMQNILGEGGKSILSPLWSLPFEVQMYLVLPALYFLTLRKRAVTYLCGLFAFFCCFRFLIFKAVGYHLDIAVYVPCFLSGVLCYSLQDRVRAYVPSAFWPAFVFLFFPGYWITRIQYGEHSFYWIGWIYCLFLGLAINFFHDSTYKHLNIVAEKVALYSFSIYLIHVPILYLVFMVLAIKNLVLGAALFVALTVVASVITYHLIESPFIEIGRKLSFRPVRTSPTADTVGLA